MFEISAHKVSSILSIYLQAKIGSFLAKSSQSVLDDTLTQRADISGFGSTSGYNLTPHYRVLGLTACYRNLQKKMSLKIEVILFSFL